MVTAPVRLATKGALEIYLPKAAPFFLYLFTPAGAKLPDLMARKKKKQEKIKKFIVDGIGMKEAHFMGILRNNLTKRFKKSPEKYLAERLNKRVSGIAGDNLRQAIMRRKLQNKKTSRFRIPVTSDRIQGIGYFSAVDGVGNTAAASNVLNKAAQGDLVGTVLSALSWLVSKIGGAKKKGLDDKITINDMPDIERDASNAFEFKDLSNDFSNLSNLQKEQVKETTTDIIEDIQNLPAVQRINKNIEQQVKAKLPFLNQQQIKEIAAEVEEGPEPITTQEGKNLGVEIKTDGLPNGGLNPDNGGGGRNLCNC